MSSRTKIRVAVIGVGYLGRFHAQKYAMMDDVELVGVVDADPARAQSVAEEVKTTAFKDPAGLHGLVDAVSIVTPTEHHYRLGMDFLSKGVHVMMEKPITAVSSEARELVKAAAASKALLQVGHLERFNGAMLALGDNIKDPLYIEAVRTSPFPNRSTDVDVILDVMIHDIDLVLSIARSEPTKVEAVAIPVVSNKADFANARITFKSGCVANITASRVSKERIRKINVVQPDAMITIDYATQGLTITRTVPGSPVAGQTDDNITVEKKDSLLEELKSFICSIKTGKTPVVSGSDGTAALELAERIQSAANV